MTEVEGILQRDPNNVNMFLSNSGTLNDMGLLHIQRHMKDTPSVCILELRGCDIGRKGAEVLVSGIAGHPNLQHLGLSRNSIDTHTMVGIITVLDRTPIQTIDLSWNSLKDPVATALATMMRTSTTLVAISLEHNDIGVNGVISIANALAENTTVQNLNIGWNKAAVHGCEALAEALAVNTSLLTLNLSSNGVLSEGAKALASGLQTNKTLKSLNLQYNNVSEGLQDLGSALRSVTSLTELNLYANRLPPSHCAGFAAGLRECRNMLGLSFGKTLLSDQGAVPILDACARIVALLHLDMSGCNITIKSMDALSVIMSSCPNLETLLLDENPLYSESAAKLGGAIGDAASLTCLGLTKCRISVEGGNALGRGLRLRKGLPIRDLRLSDNEMGNPGIESIINGLCSHGVCGLTALDVSSNNLSPGIIPALEKILNQHKELESVTIRANDVANELASSWATLGGIGVWREDRDQLAREYANAHESPKEAAATCEDKATLAPKEAVAVTSNFNGSSAAWRQMAPLTVTAAKEVKPHVLSVSAVQSPQASRRRVSLERSAYDIPGLSPIQTPMQRRHQLHELEGNVGQLNITDAQLRRKFQELDTNANGSIDAAEFAAMYKTMESYGVELNDRKVQELIGKFSRDGQIMFDEFCILMLQLANR